MSVIKVHQPTETRPRAMASCNLRPDPLKGNRPESRTWSITPAPQTSHAFPYCRRVKTSGAM